MANAAGHSESSNTTPARSADAKPPSSFQMSPVCPPTTVPETHDFQARMFLALGIFIVYAASFFLPSLISLDAPKGTSEPFVSRLVFYFVFMFPANLANPLFLTGLFFFARGKLVHSLVLSIVAMAVGFLGAIWFGNLLGPGFWLWIMSMALLCIASWTLKLCVRDYDPA